jgi:dipeptidyl aminopeptidase/acylaminoacyl peptidase
MELRELLELPRALALDADDESVLVAADFSGTLQLYRAHAGSLEQLTDEEEPVDGLLVPRDGVLVSKDTGGDEKHQLYRLADERMLEPLVVESGFAHWTPQVSRDGRLLAYASNRGSGRDFAVFVRELAIGEERCVFDPGGLVEVLGFSPRAEKLALSRTGARAGDNELWIVDLTSREKTEVFPHDDAAAIGSPAWLDEERFVVASSVGRDTTAIVRENGRLVLESEWDLECVGDPSGQTVLVAANEDGYSRLELRDPETFALRAEVPLPGRGVVEAARFSPDGRRLVYTFSSPVEPPNVWSHDVADGTAGRVTAIPAPPGLREPELHRYESFDGLEVPVFLWRPAGAGPFPVVVMVHGGPEAQFRPGWLPSFTPLTQHLLARGIAVAAPNVRGSSGYGKRYEHLDDVDLRLDSVRDLAALHEWLGARPELDGGRIAIYGRSYGGYMVLAALAFQPDHWAAGVESVGISNLVSFLENTSDYRRAAREREYGRLDLDRAFLVAASPLTHVDRMRAPLFVQHGANDPRVPLGETEQIHRVLSEKGIRCELLVHPDEGHGIAKRENRIEFFERAAAFLEDELRRSAYVRAATFLQQTSASLPSVGSCGQRGRGGV